jgi:hypothetical protein
MAVSVLTHQKMPSHALLLQKKFKNYKEQKPLQFSANRRR